MCRAFRMTRSVVIRVSISPGAIHKYKLIRKTEVKTSLGSVPRLGCALRETDYVYMEDR